MRNAVQRSYRSFRPYQLQRYCSQGITFGDVRKLFTRTISSNGYSSTPTQTGPLGRKINEGSLLSGSPSSSYRLFSHHPAAFGRSNWYHGKGTSSTKDLLDHFKSRIKSNKQPKTRPPPVQDQEGRRMKSHIQFITVPTVDTPGTGLVLHFDTHRYFFGQLHEGLQRASLQHGSKLLKVRQFFMTGKTDVQTTGGLLGVILTLADASNSSLESIREANAAKEEASARRAMEDELNKRKSKPNPPRSKRIIPIGPETVVVHGAPNIMHTLAAARSFIFRQGLPLDVDEFAEGTERTGPGSDWKPTWEDVNIKVWAMPIVPTAGGGVMAMDGVKSSDGQGLTRKRSHEVYIKGQQEDLQSSQGHEDTESVQEEQAKQLREYVVHEMFKSAWRGDQLTETKLADVKLPAQLFFRDPETRRILPYRGPLPSDVDPRSDVKVLVRQPWPGALVHALPPTRPSATAMSYIVQVQEQRGKFLVQKATDLGVPKGPLYSELTKGKSVILKDGRVVTAEQVLEPGKPGGGIAIIDLPTKDYVASLVDRPEWSQEKIMRGVEVVTWILGPGVAQDKSLEAFMERFDQMKHIISSPDYCPNQLIMTSAASALIRHHIIDPNRYSLLQHDNRPQTKDPWSNGNSNHIVARPGLSVQLEPRVEIDERDIHHPVNLVAGLDTLSPTILSLAEQARTHIMAESTQPQPEDQKLPSHDAEIICLGTGSAAPSLHRNVSGTLLRVPGHGSYLFDAGENTLGQLKRIYSPQEFKEVLRDLKMIWISHMHADHHLGTASIIKEWYSVVHGGPNIEGPSPSSKDSVAKMCDILRDGRRLFIVGSTQMLRWLEEYSSVEDYGFKQIVSLLPAPIGFSGGKAMEPHCSWDSVDVSLESCPDHELRSAMQAATGLVSLKTCFVRHCHEAQAISITFADGFKFSYSGDCRPSRDFAAIGKGSTVLVHEATFDDELQMEAEAKKHSTISEAVGVGAEMEAKRVILTHFSQRYQKIPTMSDLAGIEVRLDSAQVDRDNNGDGPHEEPMGHPDTAMEEASDVRKSSRQGRGDATPVKIHPNRDMKIAVAFDYMRVKVKDIASLEHFTPSLRELYKEEEVKPVKDVNVGDGKAKEEEGDGTMQRDSVNPDQKSSGKLGKRSKNRKLGLSEAATE